MEHVTIISDTQQEFLKVRYYLCGRYFQHKGKRLHRAVWEYFNGDIPEGYHIHHLDEDRGNNQIENLALLPGPDHERIHAGKLERIENGKRAIAFAILAAPEWHRSEAGAAWHSKHAKEYWEQAPLNEYVCNVCGKHYLSKAVRHKGNHFCCGNCRAKYGRMKRRNANESDRHI